MVFALAGARIFDGAHCSTTMRSSSRARRIAAVAPQRDLPAAIERREVDGLLAPGFIDVQVNGGGGVLLNDVPTVEGIRAIGRAHRRFGTTGLLPTLITDTRERMGEALAAVRAAIRRGVPGVLGIHLEGPFLNPARKGVHEPAHMRPMEDEDFRLITSLGEGVTLVTLAPERVPPGAVRRLAAAGAIVSAGHTAANTASCTRRCRQGLRGFTHLFNAMPPLAGREPGPVGAALDEPRDLVRPHRRWPSRGRRLAAHRHRRQGAGPDDARDRRHAHRRLRPSAFELLGPDRHRAGGRLTHADGTLAGSDLDMASAVRNAVRRLGLSLPRALQMASRAPAAFLRLGHERGRIAPGYRADLVLLDADLEVRETWIGGEDGAADAD